jgi:hypothetical protein
VLALLLSNACYAEDLQRILKWVRDSGDNRHQPFLIVDKAKAEVWLFNGRGVLLEAAPALLGSAMGDDSAPGIGRRKLASIRPDERTTPAGRFVTSLGKNLHGTTILWVDYENSVSLHRVINTPAEHRPERLASPSPLDNRITFGCINVPAKFFNRRIFPTFLTTQGVAYVLPEVRSLEQTFGLYGYVRQRTD